MANQHIESYEQHVLSPETLAYFEGLTQTSLAEQQQLEQDTSISFEDYLSKFR
jgi:glutamate--cysteine ligase